MQPQTSLERRLVRKDRRQPRPALAPTSGERRRGERRQLPRSRWSQWPSLLASAAVGVVVAVLLQSLGGAAGGPVPVPMVVVGPPEPAVAAAVPAVSLSLDEAAMLRDAAQRLTPAGVALDEQARLYWTPRRAELDAAAADPRTPGPVREELEAARSALAQVGL